jgi:hypothetical protein
MRWASHQGSEFSLQRIAACWNPSHLDLTFANPVVKHFRDDGQASIGMDDAAGVCENSPGIMREPPYRFAYAMVGDVAKRLPDDAEIPLVARESI